MKLGCIYSLNNPITNEIRYIGQTIVNPRSRYAQHKYQWKRSNKLNKLNQWIKSLADKNLLPSMNIIEDNILIDELDNREIFWLKYYKDLNYKLCNLNEGGKGNRGYKFSEESKQKRLESLKNSKLWKERSLRHSEIMKEKYKNGHIGFNFNSLSSQEKLEINNKKSRTMKKLYEEGLLKLHCKEVLLEKIDGSYSKIFSSATSVSKFLNCSDSLVNKCCSGELKTLKKFYRAKYIQKSNQK